MISYLRKIIYKKNSEKEISIANSIIHAIINNTIDDTIIKMVNNIDFYYVTSEKKTILMFACEYSKHEIVNILLYNKYSDVGYCHHVFVHCTSFNHYYKHNTTALIYACENYNNDVNMELAILKLIETELTDLHISNWDNRTAIILACQKNITNVVLKLIEINKSLAGDVDFFGYTPLIYACINNNTKLALKLIDTNQSNINQDCRMNIHGKQKIYHNALIFALKNNMDTVITKILNVDKNNEIKFKTIMFIKEYKLTDIDNKLSTYSHQNF